MVYARGDPHFEGLLSTHAPADDDYVLVLDADLAFVDSAGNRVIAHRGLETDGASVRALMNIPVIGILTRIVLRGDPFSGPFRWAAVIHDDGYARATDTSWWAALWSGDRATADRRIREGAMAKYALIAGIKVRRTPAQPWRAWTVWALLRIFGATAWLDDSRASRSLSHCGPDDTE